jgi:hypothetical protein
MVLAQRWLPLVGMTGVIAYLCQARKDWVKKLLLLCFFIAMVPGLNSLFIALNNSYYARWFYMPILIMCMASVIALKARAKRTCCAARGGIWGGHPLCGGIGLTPQKVEDKWVIGLYDAADRFWSYSIIALVCAAVVVLILVYLRGSRSYRRALISSVAAMSLIFTTVFLGMGTTTKSNRNFMVQHCHRRAASDRSAAGTLRALRFLRGHGESGHVLGSAEYPGLPQHCAGFTDGVLSAGWSQADVSSKPEATYYALRSLLSVRWLFIADSSEKQTPMPDFRYYDNQMGFNIYENENFLPMGLLTTTILPGKPSMPPTRMSALSCCSRRCCSRGTRWNITAISSTRCTTRTMARSPRMTSVRMWRTAARRVATAL